MKRKWWRYLGLTGISVVFLFTVCVFAAPQSEGGQDESISGNRFIYLKENTLYWHDADQGIGDELDTAENGDLLINNHYIARTGEPLTLRMLMFLNTRFSPGQRYLCSYSNYDAAQFVSDLMIQDMEHLDQPPEIIDQGVTSYMFLTEQTLLYLKRNSGMQKSAYYFYDIDKKERFLMPIDLEEKSQDGYIFKIDNDRKQMLWREHGYSAKSNWLYLIDLEDLTADKKLLISDFERIKYVSDDFQTIYYELGEIGDRVNNKMYCLKDLSKISLVAEKYYNFDIVEPSGNAYWEQRSGSVAVIDFINDDMTAIDAAMKIPQESELSSEEYQNAMAEYLLKQERDLIRAQTDVGMDGVRQNLFYFNGVQNIKVASNVISYDIIEDGLDAIAARVISPPLHSINMSEITSDSDAYFKARELMLQDVRTAFITEGYCYTLPVETEANSVYWRGIGMDINEKLVYYLDRRQNDSESQDNTVLMTVPYSSSGLGSPVELDHDVDFIVNLSGGTAYYTKENPQDEDTCSLYFKGSLISEDLFDLRWYDGVLYYLKKEPPAYSLYRFDGTNNDKIMTGSHWFLPLGENYVAVVKDGKEEGQGNLYLWTKGAGASLIASDIQVLSGAMTTLDTEDMGWEH